MVLRSLCFLFLPVVHSTGMTKDKEAIVVALLIVLLVVE